MSCESKQEQVSLLIDARLRESDQVVLFRHLEECEECRQFFDSMIRMRRAVKDDQEAILLAAAEVLPPGIPSPPAWPRPGARRWLKALTGGWRVPAPIAVGLAVLLLAGGALLGSRVGYVPGQRGAEGHRSPSGASVVVVCGLPPVDVVGVSPRN